MQFFLLGLIGYDLIREKTYADRLVSFFWYAYSAWFYYYNRVVLNQGSYFIGLDNTSPVFASTIENSVPAITFVLAAIFRQASYTIFSLFFLIKPCKKNFIYNFLGMFWINAELNKWTWIEKMV